MSKDVISNILLDLRAALKVQPTNQEAMAELASLIPSETISLPPASSSSYQYPYVPSPTNREYERLFSPKPKQLHPPPFSQSKADSRKLKIVAVPMTVDLPVVDFGGSVGTTTIPSTLRNRRDKEKQMSGEKKRVAATGSSSIKIKSSTIIYPSWERYVVQRVN